MENKYDLIIIGAGPGGTDAAEAAAARGMKTAIIEKGNIGGTCLNKGCVPTKTILHATEVYRQAKEGAEFGIINQDALQVDAEGLQEYKEKTLETLREGLSFSMKHAKVDMIQGSATIIDSGLVKVGDETYETDKILIATGSVPTRLPIEGADLPGVITSDEMLSLKTIPERIVIIGGGVIGIEFASIYSSLGSKVTIVEFQKRILFNFDKEISRSIAMVLGKRDVDIHTDSAVKSIALAEDGKTLKCSYEFKGEVHEAEGDLVLMSAGRVPYVEGLIGEESSDAVKAMEVGRKGIAVNEKYETGVPGIYAIGDAIGGIQLAHVASAEGVNAVACMAGEEPPVRMSEVPSCVYTDPELASVGITADDAKAAGIKVVSKKYLMGGNGKSVLTRQERGFIKVIADAETEKVLGAQMMCARATDMITQFSQAIAAGLTLSDMAGFIYPHPTFCEAIGKAAAK